MLICIGGLGDAGSIMGIDRTLPYEACFTLDWLDCPLVSSEGRRVGSVLRIAFIGEPSTGSCGIGFDLLPFFGGRGPPRSTCFVARGKSILVRELAGSGLIGTSCDPVFAPRSGGDRTAREWWENALFPFVSAPYRRRLRRIIGSGFSSSEDGRS